jgi:hypothetical protein
VVYNIGHIHPFFNLPKKSNLLINMSRGSIYEAITQTPDTIMTH